MPVYEIVLREPSVPQRISFSSLALTELGDLVLADDKEWIVVEKQPPFELRKIERLICQPRLPLPPQSPRGAGLFRIDR